jgi:hypothetical protein
VVYDYCLAAATDCTAHYVRGGQLFRLASAAVDCRDAVRVYVSFISTRKELIN